MPVPVELTQEEIALLLDAAEEFLADLNIDYPIREKVDVLQHAIMMLQMAQER